MRMLLSWLLVPATALILAGCDVDVEEEGKMPDVDVEEGEMPEADVEGPDVDVETDKEKIEVPDVDVETEEKTIPTPDVDVDVPEDDDNAPGGAATPDEE